MYQLSIVLTLVLNDVFFQVKKVQLIVFKIGLEDQVGSLMKENLLFTRITLGLLTA